MPSNKKDASLSTFFRSIRASQKNDAYYKKIAKKLDITLPKAKNRKTGKQTVLISANLKRSLSAKLNANPKLKKKLLPRPVKDSEYRAAARQLQKYTSFGFDRRKKLSSAAKASITKKAASLAVFIEEIRESEKRNLGQQSKFVKFKTKAERKRAIAILGDKVVTDKGFFIKTPSARGKKQKAEITDTYIKITTGKQVRFIYSIDNAVDFMFSPMQVIGEKLLENFGDFGEPDSVAFTFNGYAMSDAIGLEDVNAWFARYLDSDMSDALNGYMLIYSL